MPDLYNVKCALALEESHEFARQAVSKRRRQHWRSRRAVQLRPLAHIFDTQWTVLVLAMAMSRLPGHASGSERTTPHSTPLRSTTAAHILLGENKPPLLSWTTDDNWLSTLLTTEFDNEHPLRPWPSSAHAPPARANNTTPIKKNSLHDFLPSSKLLVGKPLDVQQA